MASLENRNGKYRVVLRVDGRKVGRSLKTSDERKARLALARLEDNLHRVELGTLTVDPDADVMETLLLPGTPKSVPLKLRSATLGKVLDDYLDSFPDGSIETTTRCTITTHVKHLKRILGTKTMPIEIGLETLQRYVNQRSEERNRSGKLIQPVTIKKELSTLSSAWRWAKQADLITRDLPQKSMLRYRKTDEKPPFRTWNEIERLVTRKGIRQSEVKKHWDCLFLDCAELNDLVNDVGRLQAPRFLQPMVAFAAYTGARRSEMLRSIVDDIDLEGGHALLKEKKRVRGQRSNRSVPIAPTLGHILKRWLNEHPGGTSTFTIDGSCLSPAQAQDCFKRNLANTRWSVLRGWHTLRHSFISNCASRGVDQRMIDDWVGHQTDAMRKRYRHLFPNAQREAIASVFDD